MGECDQERRRSSGGADHAHRRRRQGGRDRPDAAARAVLAARAGAGGGAGARRARRQQERRSRNRYRAPDCRRWSRATRCGCAAALENLADNAVKFTERGARRALPPRRAGRAQARAAGVHGHRQRHRASRPPNSKRLFRPFAQASDEVARRYGGAGLGLVFVKRIAKAMGGDLKVTSKPGRGSTFRLTVLVERRRGAAGARSATARAARRRARSRCCAPRTIRTAAW